ncbi:MAG TPA: CopD family protein [Stellaceae bacterium]|nr:CopD family protein [Stellaceae bacterium]
MIVGLLFHSLAAVVWVGGMFFAHQVLRPAAGPLDPAVRLPLWERVLGRFFLWVWACVILLLASGYGMFAAGVRGIYVDIMQTIGIIMMLIFAHLYFAPWKRFRRAVAAGNFPDAAAQLAQIRKIVGINLVLGLIVVIIGATGPYWG